jgi:cyclopropane-fatty-acyl-phospholipid synthase
MGAVAVVPDSERGVAPVVYTCYEVLDLCPAGGVHDFTDGKYVDDRNDRSAYLAAQRRQAEYLLDQIHCGPGSRILDIGCGYGRILEHAARCGARATGITISRPQVAYCQSRGLNVYELNYRDIFRNECTNSPPTPPYKGEEQSWHGAFDGLVANGSLEHFAQLEDAVADRVDEVYNEMFAICRRLLGDGGRLVTTAIHFRNAGQFSPQQLISGSRGQRPGSDEFHYAQLSHCFGGWNPEPGQLERCAAPIFDLVAEEDGTHDYHLTSEYWLKRLEWSLAFQPRVWWKLARMGWRHPRPLAAMLRCLAWDQSWAWQFRPPAPMRLWRHTWQAKPL